MTGLKQTLDGFYKKYHDASYLRFDPLEFVRGLQGRDDRELGGLLCASLSYGRVEQIRASIAKILNVTGGEVYRFACETPLSAKIACLSHVKHRFNTGLDMAVLLECGARAIQRHGSLESFFCQGLKDSHRTVREGLDAFVFGLKSVAATLEKRHSRFFGFLLSAPSSGSACKRLAMFLRWMVREDDGIDLGLWKSVSPSKLVMPVDTHVAALSRTLGLTERKTADWAMAEEITAVMRSVCPLDPVRYDFSLCRTGMIDFRNMAKAA